MSVKMICVPILLLWGVLACESGDETSAAGGLVQGLDPVEIGPAEAVPLSPWQVGASPLLRIGGSDDRESHLLVEVGDGTVASDGSVIVADARTGVVRVYDPSGGFLTTIGAAGDGPGEFRSPSDLLIARGDSILVWDQTHWRTSIFSPEGKFVRSERYDPADPGLFPIQGMWPAGVELGPNGAYLVRLLGKANAKGAVGAQEVPEEGSMGFAIHFPETGDLDLVVSLPKKRTVQVEAPWGSQEMVLPLGGEPQAVMDLREVRVCAGYSATPEVFCRDGSDAAIGVSWASAGRPVRAEDPDVAEWRQKTSEAYSLKISRREMEQLLSQVPLPDQEPAFRSLHLDEMGFLWVELSPPEDDRSMREYLVLDRDLDTAGRVQLPSLRLLEIGAEYVLGVRKDSVGREEVVLFSLSRE